MQKPSIFYRHLPKPFNPLKTKYLHYKFTKLFEQVVAMGYEYFGEGRTIFNVASPLFCPVVIDAIRRGGLEESEFCCIINSVGCTHRCFMTPLWGLRKLW